MGDTDLEDKEEIVKKIKFPREIRMNLFLKSGLIKVFALKQCMIDLLRNIGV